jgi:hypothetical protein
VSSKKSKSSPFSSVGCSSPIKCDAATFDGRDNSTFGLLIPGKKDGAIDDFECDIDGGAKNFLFYGGVYLYLPFEMSPDQAKSLRRHPLFTRVK